MAKGVVVVEVGEVREEVKVEVANKIGVVVVEEVREEVDEDMCPLKECG